MKSRNSFPVVCPFDEAIDPRESNLNLYVRTRDMKHLKFLPGELPVIFHTIRLPTSVVMRAIERAGTEAEKHTLAFCYGVVKVENFRTEDRPDPHTWSPGRTIDTSFGKLTAIDDEELELFAPSEVADIGSVCHQRAFLARRRQPTFVPPDSSAQALALTTASRRLVAASETLPQNSDEAPEQPAQPQSESGGGATDAPVTASPTA